MKIDKIKRSDLSNFNAEVYSEELKYLLRDKERSYAIRKEGVNKRVFSQDVIDLSSETYVKDNQLRETILIHLSRNSLYHQLPEFFFYPLSLGGKEHREKIGLIKENKKIEEENIKFFIPFDSEIFDQNVNITNRFLHLFTNEESQRNLFNIAREVVYKNISLTQEQYYALLLNLCNVENLKENLPRLEKVLFNVLGYKVELKFKKNTIDDIPFETLSQGHLGFDLGLHGSVESSFDDVVASLYLKEHIEYKKIIDLKNNIVEILYFFLLSNREILFEYRCSNQNEMTLGKEFLGFDTVLTLKP